MELKIDGKVCEVTSSESASRSWSSTSLRSIAAQREGWEVEISLPITPANSQLLGHPDQPHMVERFNHSRHTATLSWEGTTLFTGSAHLISSNPSTPEAGYRLRIRGGTADWAHTAATSQLDELPIDFSMSLTPERIVQSWSEESPVRFLPIRYDDYQTDYAEGSVMPVERILSTDDYHPFLHAATLVRKIVEQQGYTLRSAFVESDFFQELYVSGAYPERNVEALQRRLDFLARRTADGTTTANSSGRVYAVPHQTAHSVGNLVDAFTPQATDEEGNVLSDCFTANNSLKMEDGVLLYRPGCEAEVGFEYRLSYTTDYRILSRTRLTGFDSLSLGSNADFRFELANRFEDRRSELTAGQNYRLIVFGHTEGETYRLLLGDGSLVAEFASRTASVSLPAAGEPGTATLYHREDGVWSPWEGDWALYDGFITECGTTEVELTLRTSPEPLGPTTPKYFNNIFFYGAEPGMSFTLHKGSRLTPFFSSRPGLGSVVDWSNVTALGITQGELLEALGHLFNWRIFTDEEQRVVTIEPAERFYETEECIDWSSRMVKSDLAIEESDCEEHGIRHYGYIEGDGTVERFNHREGEHFGRWSVLMDSTATRSGVERLTNPLFSATLNEAGGMEGAPSALIPVVGNRDDMESIDTLHFTPRILRYRGLHPLPAGERWGYPAAEGYYPLAAFHFAGDDHSEGFTLCFEDREGLPGLHRFYDDELCHRNLARRLRATLRVEPFEAEALWHLAEAGSPGLNATFRLRLEGEPVKGRLERIERYDPASGIIRCSFTLLCDDSL